MITVRLEYGGMRFENTVPDEQAESTLARMYERHRIRVRHARDDRMRGYATITGDRSVAKFIDPETGDTCNRHVDEHGSEDVQS